MRFGNRALIAMLLIGYGATGWSYPWDQDMVDQPSEKPQESVAPAEPQSSIPTGGGETVPAPTTERDMFDAKDAAVSVKNPVPARESPTRPKKRSGFLVNFIRKNTVNRSSARRT